MGRALNDCAGNSAPGYSEPKPTFLLSAKEALKVLDRKCVRRKHQEFSRTTRLMVGFRSARLSKPGSFKGGDIN